jgi:predicted regulator of Ras-like GTPase activity (Roadblock/LC7/MglB family)
MDAAQALADLTEISSQIEAAVVMEADGTVLASTFADEARAERLARAARGLLAAAEQVRGDSGEPLAQLEAATAEGSVFVVRDRQRLIAATTSPEPTVGLVFYDLKSCLRAVAAADDEEAKPRPKAKRAADKQKAGEGADPDDGA